MRLRLAARSNAPPAPLTAGTRALNLLASSAQKWRREKISIGMRSERHSRNSPPKKNTMLPSHKPGPAAILPWRASDIPASERK